MQTYPSLVSVLEELVSVTVMWKLLWMTHYPHGQTHWGKSISDQSNTDKKRAGCNLAQQKKFMYAKIKLPKLDRIYQYSRVQTVSTILQKAFERAVQM